jgi:hypothetical protein
VYYAGEVLHLSVRHHSFLRIAMTVMAVVVRLVLVE